mmetsp:Transcript_75176/g.132806  ORF Transcript_75176/g.132806 Transcript_75176/m.132806 type:complete len:248 (-) Transcript_75176:112-855(-)|eukprot:CAMPEP_0197659168 /NCGR_PEP_ID=MMETSP1338-20131121/46439_1 /TAXON_ID=43686 ORGANISM="Pelagodinium beii, Strain RCC1491" /NCGR_SAMPLE_ID=MMETSP1338 /ASSEMBLY_ACC=CAM_ASM_000754 /LENGTH=247 /DNA_ID=CAMNT_0043235951 /DNA_START=127 /DNA_END=870 /DNA_ORIENTATION=-
MKLLLALSALSAELAASYSCNSACEIYDNEVDDGYCDCPDCSDESEWSCSSCGTGCPDYPGSCEDRSRNCAGSLFVCDDGCQVDNVFVDDGDCDCGNCEDESSWTCSSCGGCPESCGEASFCSFSEYSYSDYSDLVSAVNSTMQMMMIIQIVVFLIRAGIFAYATYWCWKKNKQLQESGQGATCGGVTCMCCFCCTIFAICFTVDPANPMPRQAVGAPVVVGATVQAQPVQAQVVQAQVVKDDSNTA